MLVRAVQPGTPGHKGNKEEGIKVVGQLRAAVWEPQFVLFHEKRRKFS